MALVKTPVPVPSAVFASLIVGFELVLQHTPRAVTVPPPAEVTLPPLDALFDVIAVTVVVVTVGATARVVKLTSAPYDVPAPFVA